jgi:outer membrane protein TolC
MRLYQYFRPSIARVAVTGTLALVFASEMPLSASGQAAQTQQAAATTPAATPRRAQEPLPPSPVANGTPLSMDEAVRMALENNLGIQAERINPEIQNLAVAQANAVYAPNLVSSLTRSNSTAPPTDFLSSSADVVTNGNFFTQAGVQQQIRWGGASYQVTFDGSRGTSDAPNNPFPLSLRSNMSALFNQPLLRDFKIDAARRQIITARNNQTITDLQLQQRITQTARNARAAYYNLVGAISGLEVAQESLMIARESLRNNQTRVEVGTMAPIDITAAEAEVASNEEAVIVQEAAIKSAQDQLRTLIMNPAQPGFWTAVFKPTDTPTLEARAIDVDAAVRNALTNRTDIQQLRKQMANTDVSVKFAQNQKLPAVDLTARYGVTGVGGTRNRYEQGEAGLPILIGTTARGFGEVVRDVFGNDFRTWSVALNVNYPIGQSQADAAFAQAKLQQRQESTNLAELEMAVTTSVRLAARQVETNLKRVEATRKAKDFAQKRLDAENKRFTVGLSTTFELTQAQRDLSRAKSSELNALLDYNQSLVDFEAVQVAPIR